MAAFKTFATLVVAVMALLIQAVHAASDLPIFFFHGVTGSAASGANFASNLTAEGRVFNALTFCQSSCSVEALTIQVPLAIAQIRTIIENDTSTYEDGYIFVAHSQGGAIARAVIEEMDDHNVKTFVSLAGAQNGNFYGPQAADTVALYIFLEYFASAMIPTSVFDFSTYSSSDYRGKLQYDFNEVLADTPSLSELYSVANLYRSPDNTPWLSWNPFLPVYNNINECSDSDCESEQARRKANFVRLEMAYFFVSPRDGVISPYQSSIFGQYGTVSNATDIETDFEDLEILSMEETTEYLNDTYGLKTLYTSGKLELHLLDAVSHECWLEDTVFYDDTTEACYFADSYANVYPLL